MNHLTTIIVNDGDGYKQRLALATQTLGAELSPAVIVSRWTSIVTAACRAHYRQFSEHFSVDEIAQTITELHHYYQEHVAEVDPADRPRA